MKIPVGEFGLRAPGESGRPNVQPGAFVQQGLTDAGDAGIRLGTAMGTEAANEAQLQAQERRREQLERVAEQKLIAREAKSAEAMTLHAEGENVLRSAAMTISRGVADGSVKRDDAPRLWQEQSQQIVEDHVARADKASVPLVRSNFMRNVGAFGAHIDDVVATRGQQDIGAAMYSTLDQLKHKAAFDLPNAIEEARMALRGRGPTAGLNPEQIVKMEQAFVKDATFENVQRQVNESMRSMQALAAAQKRVTAEPNLDEGQRNALLNNVQNGQYRLQAHAEAAQHRREAGALRAMNVIEKTISMGVPVDAKTWVATQAAVRGTEFEPMVTGLMAAERDTQQMLARPIPEQIAAVNAAEARANTGGGLREKIYADRLGKTVRNNVTMLTQTPLVYAVQRQGADGTPLDLANLGSWGDIMGARLAAVDPLAKEFNVGRRLLYPQEATQLATMLQGASSQQATQVFSALRKAIPDDKAYRDTIGQIAPDDPVTAYAGGLMGKTKPAVREGWFSTSTAPDPQIVSRTLLDGRRILAPSKGEKGDDGNRKGMFKMPTDKEFDAVFEAATKSIYAGNPDARSIDYQAVRAYYAGKASEQGKYDGGLDDGLVRDAVTAVLGGVSDRYGRVVRPYGWAEDQFRDQVQRSWLTTVRANNLPVQLKDARIKLRNGPREGQYYVLDGTSFLSDAKGQPIMINVLGAE